MGKRRCSVCGEPARYMVGMQVSIFDTESPRTRIKEINVHLCAACEAKSQRFFQRDMEQQVRVATAITPEMRANPLPAYFKRRFNEGAVE